MLAQNGEIVGETRVTILMLHRNQGKDVIQSRILFVFLTQAGQIRDIGRE